MPRAPAAAVEADGHRIARIELDHALVHRELGGHVLEQQVRRQRVARDRAVEERQLLEGPQLAREREEPVTLGDVERLLAEVVARQHQRLLAGIPRGEREHAVELSHAIEVGLLEQVAEHLGVALRAERVPLGLELRAQGMVVVDLPVEHHLHRTVLVGAAVRHGITHRRGQAADLLAADAAPGVDDACDSAHAGRGGRSTRRAPREGRG